MTEWRELHKPKDTVIVELSEKVGLPIFPGDSKPEPNAKYRSEDDTKPLAVRADSAGGDDLPHDPKFRLCFFPSDRLKQAMDAAGLKTRALAIYPGRAYENA